MEAMSPVTVLIVDHEETRRAACVRLLQHASQVHEYEGDDCSLNKNPPFPILSGEI